MEEQVKIYDQIKKNISSFPETVMKVITNPVGFFKEMPKTGGFIDPLIFMVAMGVAAGIVRAVLGIFGLGFTGSFFMAVASIIIVPIFVALFGFVGAAILFIIWKLLGSKEPFETSYRCAAYASAITPITAVLGIVPYVGSVIGLAWITYLIVVASVEVHSLQPKTTWMVFGIICAIFAILSLSAECTTRRVAREMSTIQMGVEKGLKDLEKMSPGEAGKAVGDFLKGLDEAGKAKK